MYVSLLHLLGLLSLGAFRLISTCVSCLILLEFISFLCNFASSDVYLFILRLFELNLGLFGPKICNFEALNFFGAKAVALVALGLSRPW